MRFDFEFLLKLSTCAYTSRPTSMGVLSILRFLNPNCSLPSDGPPQLKVKRLRPYGVLKSSNDTRYKDPDTGRSTALVNLAKLTFFRIRSFHTHNALACLGSIVRCSRSSSQECHRQIHSVSVPQPLFYPRQSGACDSERTCSTGAPAITPSRQMEPTKRRHTEACSANRARAVFLFPRYLRSKPPTCFCRFQCLVDKGGGDPRSIELDRKRYLCRRRHQHRVRGAKGL